MKFGDCAEACWTKGEGKQAEQEEPQFQEVKKKKRRNKRQRAPQPRYDWKARWEVQTRPAASKSDREERKGANSDPASSGQGINTHNLMQVQARVQITNSYNILQEAEDPGGTHNPQ